VLEIENVVRGTFEMPRDPYGQSQEQRSSMFGGMFGQRRRR